MGRREASTSAWIILWNDLEWEEVSPGLSSLQQQSDLYGTIGRSVYAEGSLLFLVGGPTTSLVFFFNLSLTFYVSEILGMKTWNSECSPKGEGHPVVPLSTFQVKAGCFYSLFRTSNISYVHTICQT